MPDDISDDNFWAQQRAAGRTHSSVDALRLEAGTVMCPHCHAPIDRDCRNTLNGGPLRNLPCHPVRLTVARKARA